MKKVSIKKQGIETHGAQMEDPTSWIAQQVAINGWGLPDRWLSDSPISPLSDEEKAKAKESRKVIVKEAKPESIVQVQKELEDGSIITEDVVTPAVEEESYMEYFFPAEYTIEITDITAEIEQEKEQAEARRYLNETDWMLIRELEGGKKVPSKVKDSRAEARLKLSKDLQASEEKANKGLIKKVLKALGLG